ncbi:hypothetical protein NA57DRAFT_73521 [Rhizodiscina lignyota]|uniref:ABM domain-containing protein n=1 Tax=Rhizodiscina lignyota TaxID=1504668 RepID=A0A9P4MDY3_9PEZI|nr:hypothetical protein NA57DRAFT_73521 [Rhizodiscina lignyota]
MAPIIVIGHLKATNADARDKMIAIFNTIVEYSRSREPGVTKYCITIPQTGESGEDTDLLMIEEYADEDVQNAHISSGPVQRLLSFFQEAPGPLASPPEVYQFRPSASFTRSNINEIADPFIIFASSAYNPGKSTAAVPGWADLVSAVEATEAGTLSYNVMDDSEKSFIRIVEVYESKGFFYEKHEKSPTIAANQAEDGEWRTGERVAILLKMVGGYL